MDEIISKSVESLLQITVQNYVTDYMQANSAFRAQAGKPSKVVRITSGKCCKWCSQVAGTYIVGLDDIYNVDGKGHSVFQRHENCDCLVTWHDYRGIKNVHTKESYTLSQYEVQRTKLFSISDTYGRGFSGGVNWTGGKYRINPVPITNSPHYKESFKKGFDDVTERIINQSIPNYSSTNEVYSFYQDGILYKVDGVNVQFDPSEEEIIMGKWLQEKLGVKIQLMPKVHGEFKNKKTPDYLINGERFDLKTPEKGLGKNKIYNVLHKKRMQADNYIFNLQNYDEQGKKILIEQIKDLYFNNRMGHIRTIIVMNKSEVLRVFVRK